MGRKEADDPAWSDDLFRAFKDFDVRQVAYVPDSGHAALIRAVRADADMKAVPLTTEEEGIAVLAGAWLGGERGVLLMQSSGVGNCVNMLSVVKICRLPFLGLVTMRGEWGEFNPWQVPMGIATEQALKLMDIAILRADTPNEVRETARMGAAMAFEGGTPVALLLSQRLIGSKVFAK